MLPKVSITKQDGNTGVVATSAIGVLAIIAPASIATLANVPGAQARPDLAVNDHGYGELTEVAAYVMDVGEKPVVLVHANATTAGAVGSITTAGAGSSAITADASSHPYDAYSVVVTFVAGGTIGSAGITYTYALNGGAASAVQALGTATSLTIPNTGITLDLGTGTILAAQTATFSTTGPAMASGDLTTSLEALRTSSLGFEGIYVGGISTPSMVAAVDTWLAAREAEGRFYFAVVNGAMRGSTAESTYESTLATTWASTVSKRVIPCADGGNNVSAISGMTFARSLSMGLAGRLAAIDIGVDPARVSDGPIANFTIVDSRNNPIFHDEALFPGIDDLQISTLRSFPGRSGAYLTNARVISGPTSDYVFAQHVRVMNAACTAAQSALVGLLSSGFRKNPKANSDGSVNILEADARRFEQFAQTAAANAVSGQVTGVSFVLSRTDNVASNAGATLTGTLSIESLGYVKTFAVNAQYVTALS